MHVVRFQGLQSTWAEFYVNSLGPGFGQPGVKIMDLAWECHVHGP